MMMGTKGLGLFFDGAHFAGEFQPVHRLHRQIGENEIAFPFAQHVQRGGAIAGFWTSCMPTELSSERSSERIC